ncbi:MAG: MFS transporter [Alphaproteobacteria bacterium]
MIITLRARLDSNYRYVALAASLLLLMISWGGVFMLVVTLKPLALEQGWPRSVPSIAFALHFLGSGVGGIFMGAWLDRSGMAKPALLGTVSICIGAIYASMLATQWDIFIVYGLFMGLLGQATLFAPLTANITHWFSHRPGAAIGILASGQNLAGVVWPPLLFHLGGAYGWRTVFFWYGLFALVSMLPLVFILRRRPPAQPAPAPELPIPEMPLDGAEIAAVSARGLSPNALQAILCCAFVGCCIAMAMPMGHIVAHVSDLGIDAARGAEMLSVMLGAGFLSRFFFVGMLTNRIGGLGALFLFSFGQATGLVPASRRAIRSSPGPICRWRRWAGGSRR